MMRRLALAALLALLPSTSALAAGSITLADTNDSLEMETGAAVSTDFKTSSLVTPNTPVQQSGNANTATTTTIVSAPASGVKKVSGIQVFNRSTTAAQTVTIKFDDNATERHLVRVVLQPLESLQWNEEKGWETYTATGLVKARAAEVSFTGKSLNWYKLGTASEAAAVRYYYAKDSGFPGAWVAGSPGLNGVATDCSSSAGASTMGAPYLTDPSSGGYYLTYGAASTTVVHYIELIDVLWYNTGITVTTTTAQNITFPGLPARDCQGLSNGYGVQAAIYVQVATTNAGAVTNTTISYTDQDGNAGATGTIASFPATAVAGTFVPFQLAAGDTGIRSIQSITLGTSYGAGTIHLLLFRQVGAFPSLVANAGGALFGMLPAPAPPGVRLYNDTCLWIGYISSATTLTNLGATVTVQER